MTERPILFNGEMVRAILDGRKTQTRRMVKPEPEVGTDCPYHVGVGAYRKARVCPFGKPGDRLWVRETWRIGAWDEDTGSFALDYCDGPLRKWVNDPTDYDGERFNDLWMKCSDELDANGIKPDKEGNYHWEPGQSPLRWRPSIHMPRWASRITLEVTSVRVERLQDISEAGALQEGCRAGQWEYDNGEGTETAKETFQCLWDAIYRNWEANPWVWVIEFRMVEK